jgi:hypothetical protein
MAPDARCGLAIRSAHDRYGAAILGGRGVARDLLADHRLLPSRKQRHALRHSGADLTIPTSCFAASPD